MGDVDRVSSDWCRNTDPADNWEGRLGTCAGDGNKDRF